MAIGPDCCTRADNWLPACQVFGAPESVLSSLAPILSACQLDSLDASFTGSGQPDFEHQHWVKLGALYGSLALFVSCSAESSLAAFHIQLADCGMVSVAAAAMQVIAKAKVPIIKFTETASGFAFDVSFDVADGPVAGEFVAKLMAELPPMKPLVLVLKIFLQQRDFNEVWHWITASLASTVMRTGCRSWLGGSCGLSLCSPQIWLGIVRPQVLGS